MEGRVIYFSGAAQYKLVHELRSVQDHQYCLVITHSHYTYPCLYKPVGPIDMITLIACQQEENYIFGNVFLRRGPCPPATALRRLRITNPNHVARKSQLGMGNGKCAWMGHYMRERFGFDDIHSAFSLQYKPFFYHYLYFYFPHWVWLEANIFTSAL